MEILMVLLRTLFSACHAGQRYVLSLRNESFSIVATLKILCFCFQGDGDYELVKDVEIDDYLRKRIAKVLPS